MCSVVEMEAYVGGWLPCTVSSLQIADWFRGVRWGFREADDVVVDDDGDEGCWQGVRAAEEMDNDGSDGEQEGWEVLAASAACWLALIGISADEEHDVANKGVEVKANNSCWSSVDFSLSDWQPGLDPDEEGQCSDDEREDEEHKDLEVSNDEDDKDETEREGIDECRW